MKRKFIIIGIVLILLMGSIWLTSKYWIQLFFNFEPRKPKIEIPMTYNVGWWSNQDGLIIDSLCVKIIESKLNLFNSYSLIQYRIKGRMFCKPTGWEPEIKKIHISEKVLLIDSLNNETLRLFHIENGSSLTDTISIKPQAIIDLTPIVGLKKNRNYKGTLIPFEIKNEHKIQSLHWGNNYILIKCGRFENKLVLKQRK